MAKLVNRLLPIGSGANGRAGQNCQMAMTNLRSLREASNISLETLAFDIGISVSQVSRYETGKRDPKLSELHKIAERLNVSLPVLLGETSSQSVPLVSWVSAGLFVERPGVEPSDVEKTLHVPGLPHGDWIALRVEGDSMDRIAPENSIIFVNRSDNTLVHDRFFVIATLDHKTTFKRYRSRPSRLQPFSTNPDHETYRLRGDEAVIGRVHRVMHDLD